MNYQEKRKQILKQMAQIDSMAKGSMNAEYRETIKKNGEKVQLGPYYKYQRWENGRNVTRRVPAEEAEQLKKAVDGYHRFLELADEFVAITVEMTKESGKA
ncbi:MAG: hypothetical protein KAR40_12435 [Candidatus Sabulitectum sp.]|nr:hypothetical protein [Candidatus Sabulitectum sp.]